MSLPLTMGVPEWGRLALGIGENAAYDAAKRGDIITITIGDKLKRQRKRALVRANLLRLAGGNPELLDALMRDLAAKLEQATSTAG